MLISCVGPQGLIRVHAYDSPQKSVSEIATVYAIWGGLGGEMSFICTVDGKSYSKMGAISNCPSVVYLTPGKHDLGVSYRYANYYSNVTINVDLSAGRTYRLVSTSTDRLKTASFEISQMPPGFQLKYKDVIPSLKEKYKADGELAVLPSDSNY